MENSKTLIVENLEIKDKIYTIRGMQVMLDSDLAALYQIETFNLNKAFKRNIERFPENFCFQLTLEEYNNLRFQIGISNERGGRRYLPYAFTEQGVAMLAGILHSDVAIRNSILIINTFVEMRRYLIDNALMLQHLDKIDLKLLEHDKVIGQVLKQLEEPREKKAVLFFQGQMYDAFSCIANIIQQAKSEIILIDGYVDTATLDLLSKKKKSAVVEVYTNKNNCKLTATEVNDFNKQYGQLTVKNTTEFHDRFMILDQKVLYHIGASIKDAGKKAFEISQIDDDKQITELLKRLSVT